MTWLSDTYSELKAKWQRFKQWKRFALLREKEWRFPIDGTADNFRARFARLVPNVSREEYFQHLNRRDWDHVHGFCAADEVALRVPNQLPTGRVSKFLKTQIALHHFHGTLGRSDGSAYLCGHYRFPKHRTRTLLYGINSSFFIVILGLISVPVAYGVEALTGALALNLLVLIALFMGPTLTVIVVVGVISDWFKIRRFDRRDRHSRAETLRILTEICGNPAEPPSNRP